MRGNILRNEAKQVVSCQYETNILKCQLTVRTTNATYLTGSEQYS